MARGTYLRLKPKPLVLSTNDCPRVGALSHAFTSSIPWVALVRQTSALGYRSADQLPTKPSFFRNLEKCLLPRPTSCKHASSPPARPSHATPEGSHRGAFFTPSCVPSSVGVPLQYARRSIEILRLPSLLQNAMSSMEVPSSGHHFKKE